MLMKLSVRVHYALTEKVSYQVPPVTVPSLAQFESSFHREHSNVLHCLTEMLWKEPVIIAGGSLLRALPADVVTRTANQSIRTANWWGSTSDIEVFLYATSLQEMIHNAGQIF
jgi:hypothetical protein